MAFAAENQTNLHSPQDHQQGLRLLVIVASMLVALAMFATFGAYQWSQTSWQSLPVLEAKVKHVKRTTGYLQQASGLPALTPSCVYAIEVTLMATPQATSPVIQAPCKSELAIKTAFNGWRHPNIAELKVGDVIQVQHQSMGMLEYWHIRE
jgi:hypothetical protein